MIGTHGRSGLPHVAKSFSARLVFFHVLDLNPSYRIAYAHELSLKCKEQ